MAQSKALDLRRLLQTLNRHGVRFVVIGGVAGNLHGSATLTRDLDIVYARDRQNIRRLAAALAELDAHRRDVPKELAAPVDEQAILNGSNFLLQTQAGLLDCLGETPADRLTYEHLERTAVRFPVDGLDVLAVSLPELIRMKRAAGRDRDRIEVERLSALRDEHELREARPTYRRQRKTTKSARARKAPRGGARA